MTGKQNNSKNEDELLRLTANIVVSYVGNITLSAEQVPEVVRTVNTALRQIVQSEKGAEKITAKPAVPINRSVTPDYIICLEDGRKLKMLKRHLRTSFGFTPDEYRMRWSLPADYPMVAPNYAKRRSEFAKKIGLGQKPGNTDDS